jgi:hypothetical protein
VAEIRGIRNLTLLPVQAIEQDRLRIAAPERHSLDGVSPQWYDAKHL